MKRIKLVTAIAIIALAGCLWMTCDSSDGSGAGDGDDSSISAFGGGGNRGPVGTSWDAPIAKMQELYGEIDDFSEASRANKMKALIMEIAIKAKKQNSSFNIILQDTMELAYIDPADSGSGLDMDFLALIDGWGVESVDENEILYLLRTTGGLKMVTTTEDAEDEATRDANNSAAASMGILHFPRLGPDVYLANGYPFFATNTEYKLVEDPAVAGKAGTIHAGNVNSLRDARNYLYMINPNRYVGWDEWADDEWYLEITDNDNIGNLVPFEGGDYADSDTDLSAGDLTSYRADYTELFPSDDKWDWWWKAKGWEDDEGRAKYIADLKASNWDVIYIDAHWGDDFPLTAAEVNSLKTKANGGKRKVIAYLSIGTAEYWRWFAGPDLIDADEEIFLSGTLMGSGDSTTYEPSDSLNTAKWLLYPAYGGTYSDETLPIWWHPEWRDIIVRGVKGANINKFERESYEHSAFPSGMSSIDRIVAMGFDGVYLDNLSRYDWNGGGGRAGWTAVENYHAANPDFFFGN